MPTNKEAARVLAHPNGQRCELTQIHNHILLHAVRFGKVFCKTCAVMLALLGLAAMAALPTATVSAVLTLIGAIARPELGLRRMVYPVRNGGDAAMTPYVMREAFRTNAPDQAPRVLPHRAGHSAQQKHDRDRTAEPHPHNGRGCRLRRGRMR